MTELKNSAQASNDMRYPADFIKNYDRLELLGRGRGTQTYLVMRRSTKELFIAKCYDRSVCGEVHESDILRSLRHSGLPSFCEEYQNGGVVCVVREYVKGKPLNEALGNGSFPREKAVSICGQLCDTLIYLHGQTPPVIHRDIKPCNIILRDDGSVVLIDFDIARTQADDAEADTVVVGTRTYAPPEQYGFAQTDARTDIYALGVLLCRMLTGSADVKNASIEDKELSKIVRHCTAFSPESRYQNAAAVKRALSRASAAKKTFRLAAACAAALLILAGVSAFMLNRAPAEPTVAFKEPLMEAAVRARLGKDKGATLNADELSSVREIFIFGENAFPTMEAFDEFACGSWGDDPRGALVSLEDTALLPNLETLCVNYQALQDASGLAPSETLTYVNFSQTHLSDVGPLAKLPNLRQALLYATRVSDLTSLNACQKLEVVEAGETGVSSVEALPLSAPLKILSLKRLKFASLEGIASFVRLETLLLNGFEVDDFSPILALPSLKALYINADMTKASQTLANAKFVVFVE